MGFLHTHWETLWVFFFRQVASILTAFTAIIIIIIRISCLLNARLKKCIGQIRNDFQKGGLISFIITMIIILIIFNQSSLGPFTIVYGQSLHLSIVLLLFFSLTCIAYLCHTEKLCFLGIHIFCSISDISEFSFS